MEFLVEGLRAVTWQQVVMYLVGFVLIYLAIKKEYEPSLLLPMGFGAILVNLPFSGVLDQTLQGGIQSKGIIEWLFQVGIDASEALPILLFIGIGAMIDFGPLLTNPLMFLFGAGAQFGIFAAILLAAALGFDLKDAVSIGIIGAADGPTSLLVSQVLGSRYIGAIAVAAYSYMALVPIVQPFAIRLVTTKKERQIHMEYHPGHESHEDSFSDHCDHGGGLRVSPVGGPHRFPDVWKSDPGMRRPSHDVGDGPEHAGKPDHSPSWHHGFLQHAGGSFCHR